MLRPVKINRPAVAGRVRPDAPVTVTWQRLTPTPLRGGWWDLIQRDNGGGRESNSLSHLATDLIPFLAAGEQTTAAAALPPAAPRAGGGKDAEKRRENGGICLMLNSVEPNQDRKKQIHWKHF